MPPPPLHCGPTCLPAACPACRGSSFRQPASAAVWWWACCARKCWLAPAWLDRCSAHSWALVRPSSPPPPPAPLSHCACSSWGALVGLGGTGKAPVCGLSRGARLALIASHTATRRPRDAATRRAIARFCGCVALGKGHERTASVPRVNLQEKARKKARATCNFMCYYVMGRGSS